MGLTLDEFALWLNLEDVYWSEKGRQSIDAVSDHGAARDQPAGPAVLDRRLRGGADPARRGRRAPRRSETAFAIVPVQVAGLCLAIVCLVRASAMTGVVGLFVPLVALVGAVRPAKPDSRWARGRAGGRLGTGTPGGAFHSLTTAVSRSHPSVETVAVASARSAPAAGRPIQRAASTRSTWPWANRATSPRIARSSASSAIRPAPPRPPRSPRRGSRRARATSRDAARGSPAW